MTAPERTLASPQTLVPAPTTAPSSTSAPGATKNSRSADGADEVPLSSCSTRSTVRNANRGTHWHGRIRFFRLVRVGRSADCLPAVPAGRFSRAVVGPRIIHDLQLSDSAKRGLVTAPPAAAGAGRTGANQP